MLRREANSECSFTQNWWRPPSDGKTENRGTPGLLTQNRWRPYAELVALTPFSYAESVAGLRRIGGALFITEHFRTLFTEHSSEFSEMGGSKK